MDQGKNKPFRRGEWLTARLLRLVTRKSLEW